jgi:serine phosphatase RsbU (regulator of sigma subunit)
VADAPSGEPPPSSRNGKVERPPYSSARPPDAVADEQTLTEAEQTLADSDQTLSDTDQTSADRDQTSADRDQLAADRDQAASDHDLADSADPEEHDRSQNVREQTSRARDQTGLERDRGARLRLEVADRRDLIADRRDIAAQQRDDDAAARRLAMTELDAALEAQDDARSANSSAIIRGAARRRRAAQRREQAAAYRELAAQDRRDAARDREQAAQERLDALGDREALSTELQRERQRRDEALRHQHHAEKLARTLQRSLSPSRLPDLAGLDVAVYYEPFAPEEVGGDFYDLFPLAGARSGFFLGDVCGKGPDAATVTSLARYTMRTAAMLYESPDAILGDLNSALHMESPESMQTCTAVYGQIDMSTGAAAILLAVAGHPAPLVVRADGSVEITAAHGTMLGAVEQPVFHTCEVRLSPGDAIVLYSDGILDTEIDGARVDEARIAGLLAGPPQASAADLVDRLLRSVRRSDRPLRDDIAFMALRRTPSA